MKKYVIILKNDLFIIEAENDTQAQIKAVQVIGKKLDAIVRKVDNVFKESAGAFRMINL